MLAKTLKLVSTLSITIIALTGCNHYKGQSYRMVGGQKSQICEKIEQDMHFGNGMQNQNTSMNTTQKATLLKRYKRYDCTN